ncbi:hypothetical protein BKA70DRAFT_1577287 [Coprinopsis sp. MPI-PUGE-AT-0042]|nr:hypothetical protein BKA70DRAFT_1577287 [Coprinopsis sp. MPI-PUGE-AT-0042]
MNRSTKDHCLLRLEQIRNEIDSLRERLETLMDEEAEVSALLQQCNNELAPIRRVSDDLLREIFVWCLASPGMFDCMEAPLLLCHVSRHWRTLAMDYSLLWTSLKLDLNQSDTRHNLRNNLLSSWFERCKGSPVWLQVIFLRLRGQDQHQPIPPDHFAFLTSAVSYPPPCQFSSLTLCNIPAKTVHTCPPGAFPSLERLVLSFHDDDKPDCDEIGPILAFRNCSLLRRVAVSGSYFTALNAAISIPWQQLTHFICEEELEPSFYSKWLPQMRGLLYAYLLMGDGDVGSSRPGLFGANQQDSIRALDSITSFTISYWGTASGNVSHPDMWWECEFPNVRAFRIIAYEFEFEEAAEWEGFRFSSFIGKLESMKKIQTLSLVVARLDRSTCKTVLKCFPQLTTLDLETCDQYEHVLEALTYIPGRKLLPNLKEIAFEVGNVGGYDMLRDEGLDDDDIINVDRLEDMVKSRWRCEEDKRLRRVVFYAGQQWQLHERKPFVKCLREFEKEGLEVVLHYKEKVRDYKVDNYWFERDKDIQDWPEAGEIFNNYYERR